MATSCLYCKSEKIIKNGKRKTKERGRVQKYQCRNCKRWFCEDDGFRWKHKPKEMIVDVIELYVGGGTTLRFLAQHLVLSKNTILRWVHEYSERIARFVNRFKPKIIPRIHIDELFLKMCGTFFYIWDAICADTRFAFFNFSQTRGKKDAEELIRQFMNALEVVFDGAFQYPAVLKKMLGIWWYYQHTHRCKDFEDKKNNNMSERLQNFLRSKLHQRRGFKSHRTGILHLNLVFTYYNFVRVHSAIRQTPAEAAGLIEYYGANSEKSRWNFLIREATRSLYFYLLSATSRIVGHCPQTANTSGLNTFTETQ